MKRLIMLMSFAVFLVVGINNVYADGTKIEDGKTVSFDYTLYVKGEVADTSEGKQPLQYVHGNAMIIPGLEQELMGLKVGDEKTVVVAPENGYGPVDPKAFVEVPKANLGPDITPEPGMILQVQAQTGQMMSAIIAEVKEEMVLLNFNHPLAGQELKFEVKIVSIE